MSSIEFTLLGDSGKASKCASYSGIAGRELMFRTAFVYGALAGSATIITMILGMEFGGEGAGSQTVGFLIMFIALSLIFFGVKRYRDVEQGGVITFQKALGLGVMMAVFAGLAYIIIWEIYLNATDFAFIDKYIGSILDAKKAEGVSGEELAALIEKQEGFRASYMNPFIRLPITFTEIFPIGFLVSLFSAAILRKPEVLPPINR